MACLFLEPRANCGVDPAALGCAVFHSIAKRAIGRGVTIERVGTVVRLPQPQLPPDFPPGTTFWDCFGTPVALLPIGSPGVRARAFRGGPARGFSEKLLLSDGGTISFEEFKRLIAESISSPARLHGGWPREWPHSGPRPWPPVRRGAGPVLWCDGAGDVVVLNGDRSMLCEGGVWSRLGADFCRPGGDLLELDDGWTRIDAPDLVARLLSEARSALGNRP